MHIDKKLLKWPIVSKSMELMYNRGCVLIKLIVAENWKLKTENTVAK